jgi:hypothetical protein
MRIPYLKKLRLLSFLAKALIFSSLALGCSSPLESPWIPELENTVSFDDTFSDKEKMTVMEGLNVWREDIGDGVGFTEVKIGRIQIHKATNEEMVEFDKQDNPKKPVGLATRHANDNDIYFIFQRIPNLKYLRLVAAHEGGHHLGMNHIPQGQTAIMNPFVNSLLLNDQHLTTYDLEQFCSYWGCND